MRHSLGALLVIAVAATPAAAQDAPRVSARGFGGVTFMSETATVFGGGLSIRLNDHIELAGEAGRLTNILTHELQRDLDDAARFMGFEYGFPMTIEGKAPGVYGAGLVRVGTLVGPRLRVYAEAGGGRARGRSAFTATAAGRDVSLEVTQALGERSETANLFTAGGGVTIPLSHMLRLDVGYRFMRFFFKDDVRINTAHISAGLRVGF